MFFIICKGVSVDTNRGGKSPRVPKTREISAIILKQSNSPDRAALPAVTLMLEPVLNSFCHSGVTWRHFFFLLEKD